MCIPVTSLARARRGVTLIELLVAVAIAAIIGAIAYPSFMATIAKGRRADGVAALTALQQAMERFRTNSTTYTSDLATLKIGTSSPDGHYIISVIPESVSATGYTLQAEATGKQDDMDDAKCKFLTITVDKGNVIYGSRDGSQSYAGAASPCWKR